jgi:hypothetical protein
MSLIGDQRSLAASCHGQSLPCPRLPAPSPPHLSCPRLQRTNALPALPPSKRKTEGNDFHTRVPCTSPRISPSHSVPADARVRDAWCKTAGWLPRRCIPNCARIYPCALFRMRLPSSPPLPLRPPCRLPSTFVEHRLATPAEGRPRLLYAALLAQASE